MYHLGSIAFYFTYFLILFGKMPVFCKFFCKLLQKTYIVLQ